MTVIDVAESEIYFHIRGKKKCRIKCGIKFIKKTLKSIWKHFISNTFNNYDSSKSGGRILISLASDQWPNKVDTSFFYILFHICIIICYTHDESTYHFINNNRINIINCNRKIIRWFVNNKLFFRLPYQPYQYINLTNNYFLFRSLF